MLLLAAYGRDWQGVQPVSLGSDPLVVVASPAELGTLYRDRWREMGEKTDDGEDVWRDEGVCVRAFVSCVYTSSGVASFVVRKGRFS